MKQYVIVARDMAQEVTAVARAKSDTFLKAILS